MFQRETKTEPLPVHCERVDVSKPPAGAEDCLYAHIVFAQCLSCSWLLALLVSFPIIKTNTKEAHKKSGAKKETRRDKKVKISSL